MTLTAITPDQVAIICPTKDQPQKVKKLLVCIEQSEVKPAQVLIADGGHNLEFMVRELSQNLNVDCLYCPEPGQILQRNFAHQHLNQEIKLVIHIDDDITFETDAIGKMINYWNEAQNTDGKPLAGASFNLINMEPLKNSIFRRMMLLGTEPKGRVSISGYAAPYNPIEQTHEVRWLIGGATAWSREIIDTCPHPLSFVTRWAVCEDLIFSYPLADSYRLMAVAEAKAYHNVQSDEMGIRQGMFYGVSSVLMRYHFVHQQKSLSLCAFIWMTFGVLAGQLAIGATGSKRHIGLFLGGCEGLARAVFNLITFQDSTRLAKSLALRKQ
jgi:glycosyltransferase involved in cell wall biosynthesis